MFIPNDYGFASGFMIRHYGKSNHWETEPKSSFRQSTFEEKFEDFPAVF